MGWLLDLPTQVRRILLARNGGTGNDQGAALYTVRRMTVRQAEDVDPGDVVRSREFDKADVVDDTTVEDVVGVVLGHWRDDGRIVNETAVQFDAVAVVVAGVTKVLLDDTVLKGEFAFPTDTPGAARGETDADVGTFGRFVSEGTPGGFAYVKMGGGGGGGTGGASFTDAGVEATFLLPTGGDYIETRIPWDGDITGWYIFGDDPTGDAEVDVWVSTPPTHPTVADTITAADLPTLTNDDYATGAATGWTLPLTKADLMTFSVNSVSGHQRVTVGVVLDRTS
jgi:hypothetical protein